MYFRHITSKGFRILIMGTLLFVGVVYLSFSIYDHVTWSFEQHLISKEENDVQSVKEHIEGYLQAQQDVARVAALNPHIKRFLASSTVEHGDMAHEVIDDMQQASGYSVVYVLDTDGVAVLSSNRNTPTSFLNKKYDFRPYFKEAKAGSEGTYFALGITSKARGYYTGVPIYDDTDRVIGVMAIKQDMSLFEPFLKTKGETMFVSPEGVIFLSSDPEYIMRSLWPLSESTQRALRDSKQFSDSTFEPVFEEYIEGGSTVKYKGEERHALMRLVFDNGWTVVHFGDRGELLQYQKLVLLVIIIIDIFIFLLLLTIYIIERSQTIAHKAKERFEQVTRASKDWVWEVNTNGTYTYSNHSVEDILGYKPREVIGKTFYSFFKKDAQEEYKQLFERLKVEQTPIVRDVNESIHKDGHIVIMETNAVPVFNADGSFGGYRGVDRDITNIMQTQKKLEDAAKTLQEKVDELEKMQKFMFGREQKMIELKEKIKELKRKQK